jgi:putative phage-type endonuclease
MSKPMVIDADIKSLIEGYEIPIYTCLQSHMSWNSIMTTVLCELFEKYEISDTMDTSDVTGAKRYYIKNSVNRLFKEMVSDCEERLENKKRVLEQLEHLKTLELPEQRSEEWFAMRENVLTASSLADALGKGHFNTKESLLIDKTSTVKIPFITNEIIQWGVKYEPVATWFYEHLNQLTIVEFGLVPHPTFPIFGASPDGICDTGAKESHMVGRMLEIKCPPKRVFTAEVPFHYWMQMQGQLETCNLEECDFFQVKLEEYLTRDDYQNDVLKDGEEDDEEDDEGVREGYSGNGYPKGLVLTFLSKDTEGNPVYRYEYCPLFTSYEGCLAWCSKTLNKYEDEGISYDECLQNWWFIKRYECTLVLRDRKWWRDTMPKIIDFWEDVEHYRSVGNQSLVDKKEERKNKRKKNSETKKITIKGPAKNKKVTPTNVYKVDRQIVESLQNTNFLDSDSD